MEEHYKKSGFSLIRFLILIAGIAAVVIYAMPTYKQYMHRVYLAEAKGIIGAITTAEKAYYSQNHKYYSTKGSVSNDTVLNVNMETGTYFKTFNVKLNRWKDTFIIIITGSRGDGGVTVIYDSDPDRNGIIDSKADLQIKGL